MAWNVNRPFYAVVKNKSFGVSEPRFESPILQLTSSTQRQGALGKQTAPYEADGEMGKQF